jgi:flagellar export protein FliJ
MAFLYRLETLLRLQRSIERQEENRLLARAARVSHLRTELQAWNSLRAQKKRSALSEQGENVRGIFLQFAAEWDDAARRREKEIQEQLNAAEAARQKQTKVHQEARQRREILEGLKDRQENAYALEELRRIQKDLDEAHIFRLVGESIR